MFVAPGGNPVGVCLRASAPPRWGSQETVAELIRKLHDGDEAAQKEAGDALVAKGAAAKEPLRKALQKAGSDRRARYEEVILRLEAGTDLTYATFGKCSVSILESGVAQELPPGGAPAQRVKVVVSLDNQESSAVTVAMSKAMLHTTKGNMGLIVRTATGVPFTRQADPNVPKTFEYGAVIPPRFPVGSSAVISIEFEAGGKKQAVRTPIFTIEKKE